MSWKTTIRCYVAPSGKNRIREWYEDLSVQGKADASALLQNMRKIQPWAMPHYKKLKNCGGLGELRWISEKVQHRLLGFFKDGCWNAVMGCTHRQRIYKPADALATAEKRMKEIEKKSARVEEYDW